MKDCELLATCLFFNDKMAVNFPVAAEALKRECCKGDNAICARYQVYKALGREKVPRDLVPSDVARASRILSAIH